MSNWVYNEMNVFGITKDLIMFRNAVADDTVVFCFNKIIPKPKDTSGWRDGDRPGGYVWRLEHWNTKWEAILYWWKERLSHNTVDTEHVFVCLDKTPFCEGYYGNPFTVRQHYMKRICERAGVKPFGFHGIRHLTASVLYHKGYKLNTIQAILRHKSPRTTERYLKSLGLEHVREALEEGLKESGKVIPFNNEKTFRRASSEG